jgi:GT2 family glycosyltransferase
MSALECSLDVSIIIVNWNSADFLLDCLQSIYSNTHGLQFEIIVVDNDSPEGTLDRVAKDFSAVKLIHSTTNLGFARANNIGVQHAQGRFVLLLNPDTVILGNAISNLLSASESLADCGIAGAHLLNTDLTVQTSAIQKYPTILNQIFDIEALRLQWPKCRLWDISPLFSRELEPLKAEVISGACMLLRRDVFCNVGGFTEDFFMYSEDIDLNYKVRKIGLSSYYIPSAQLIHHGGGSSSRQAYSQWATSMKARALLLFFERTRGTYYAFAFRIVIAICAVTRLFLIALTIPFSRSRSPRVMSAKWLAILQSAMGLNKTSNKMA